jgi:dipeptidase D
VTHGDVQPADPSKWARSPFELDTETEPGRLIGRGAEDDKGPIAIALYAMKTLADLGVPLERRVELIVSYTEESDWNPFTAFLQQYPPPDLNVALDSEYPVVTAEKAWNAVMIRVPEPPDGGEGPRLMQFVGGSFLSQVPGDAEAIAIGVDDALESALRGAAERDTLAAYEFTRVDDALTVSARGLSAHSASPWDGVNAITHLAALLGAVAWQPSAAANVVRLINDLVGTDDYGARFGDIAFTHDFMGPLTLALTTLEELDEGGFEIGINIRSPLGRSGPDLDVRIRAALEHWRQETGITLEYQTTITPPYYAGDAEHVPVLLDIFRHFTGRADAQPIAIGGGTHARMVPNGVNFGPAMPDVPYTGHSEHEFMTRDQLMLNLQMYSAMLVELAGRAPK